MSHHWIDTIDVEGHTHYAARIQETTESWAPTDPTVTSIGHQTVNQRIFQLSLPTTPSEL
jgi:hypothetical protein